MKEESWAMTNEEWEMNDEQGEIRDKRWEKSEERREINEERRESSSIEKQTAITEHQNKSCNEAVKLCAEERAIIDTQPNIQNLVLTKLGHSEKHCRQICNRENGRIKSSPTIKISLLDTDDNTQELKPAKFYTKSKPKKNLDPIVIVATTPETTYYSEDESPCNKSSHFQGEQICYLWIHTLR